MKTKYKIIPLAITLGLFAWVIDAVTDYISYYQGPSFWKFFISEIPPSVLHTRLVWAGLFVFFGLLISMVLARRDRAEAALKELTGRYQGLYDNALVGLVRATIAEGKVLDCNRLFAQIFGYDNREEFITEFVAAEHYVDAGTREQMLAELKAKGEIDNFKARLSRKDGSVFWAGYSARIFPGKGYLEGVLIDISEEKSAEEKIRTLAKFPDENPNPVLRLAKDGTLLYANKAGLPLLDVWGCLRGQPSVCESLLALIAEALYSNINKEIEVESQDRIFSLIFTPVAEADYVNVYGRDVTQRKQAEEALRSTLKTSLQIQRESSALLEGSRAILEYHEFKDAAHAIFNSCKNLIGATAGYVALLKKDEINNELLFLDAGGLPCTVDPALPMPIRGLREVVYRTGKTAYRNDFSGGEWVKYLPPGHVSLDNVLFAPLIIAGKAVGLLGLANKPGGFTENDARLASNFGDLAAIALRNSQTLESLEKSEEQIRSIVQTAVDAIISSDSLGNIIFWNRAAENVFGYSPQETAGKPVTLIMPERYREAHRKGMQRLLATRESKIIGKTMELAGLRKGGQEFPLQLSLAIWETKDGTFFTSIIRDITEHKRTQEALQGAHDLLDQRVKERTAELELANEQLRLKIEEHQRAEEALRESEQARRLLASQLIIAEEKERKRIAQELHDGIGQTLNAIKFRAEHSLQQTGEPLDRERAKSLTYIVPMIQEAVEEVRRICMDLRPSVLDDLGILATMSWFCRKFQTIYPNILIEQKTNIKEEEIPALMKTTIFRVLQEALNNIAKHSQAQRVHLSLWKKNNFLKLTIEDNGEGFSPEQALSQKSDHHGLGLRSMKERVELSGGSWAIESTPGAGTRVLASWPL